MPETPPASGASTPSASASRFTNSVHSAEDLLKEQTVGLVHLSDFRKRRAEALDQVSRDGTPAASGTSTPDSRDPPAKPALFKKRKKAMKKGGLSFGDDAEEEQLEAKASNGPTPAAKSKADMPSQDTEAESDNAPTVRKKGLKPNASLSFHPQAQTKGALAREVQLKESLRREYAQIQEAVKATEFCLPFVFFDSKDVTGGVCRMKKGDHVWLFLERARKVGAEKSREGKDKGGAMKDWARIGVDDLMVVRHGLIVPHHYDFHYFILNRTKGYDDTTLFPLSPEPTSATPQHLTSSSASNSNTPEPESAGRTSNLQTATDRAASKVSFQAQRIPDDELEGFNDDPSITKVVDRRWYERNKHIYPASVWAEFDPEKNYADAGAKYARDGEGNAFFFAR